MSGHSPTSKSTNATTKIASELSKKAYSDTTTYKAMEVAIASTEKIEDELRKVIDLYKDRIDEPEFCVIYVLATDPLIKNLIRRKFYCWPWLPSPRPNQTVFLYNKAKDAITKRLWVLPNAMTMAEIASPGLIVDKAYKSMQSWSRSFFKGTFWKDIRKQHKIKLLSQEEWFELHKSELAQAVLDDPDLLIPKPFDFSKITANDVGNSENLVAN